MQEAQQRRVPLEPGGGAQGEGGQAVRPHLQPARPGVRHGRPRRRLRGGQVTEGSITGEEAAGYRGGWGAAC